MSCFTAFRLKQSLNIKRILKEYIACIISTKIIMSSHICRACLCSLFNPKDAIDMFKDLYKNTYNLSTLLPELFNIKIESNDNITKDICQGCANKIVEFHKFYLMYIESDRKLRSLNVSEIDCKPTVESYEFETANVLPHDVVAVVKQEEVYVESFKFETDDDSRISENSSVDERPVVITEQKAVNGKKERKKKRLVSLWECFACHKTYKAIKTVRKHSKTCQKLQSEIYKSKIVARGSYHKNMNNQFVCDLCNKCYNSRQSVYKHLEQHNGTKYLCNTCGKCLSNRNNLTKHHKTVHLKEKNYPCPTCNKRYDSSYRLRIHQNSHIGIRPFSCTLCPLTFLRSSALSRHKKTVHKQGELYECNICFRKFNVAYNMRAHMVTHTGIKPHVCQFCKADFTRKYKLVSHLLEVHGYSPPVVEST